MRLYTIPEMVSAQRIEGDIRALAGFGTRNTLSATSPDVRGIGAARRFIRERFEDIAASSSQPFEVFYQRELMEAEESRRIPVDTEIVNVVAVQRGTIYPDRYILMTGDIDSRNSDATGAVGDAPGANDNASGMAGVIEAARVLSAWSFDASIVYAGLSGEEQGLFGGRFLAEKAKVEGWEIIGVLNNDMIGNIEGIDGVIDNTTFRVFSEPIPATDTLEDHRRRRFYGGEVDGPSRQLARYVARMAGTYVPNLEAVMIYRLDRFGRGGHHRPFNDLGFPGVRISGAVRPSTTLSWPPVEDPDLAGYRVYWRDTTAPQWQHSRFVGKVTEYTLENIVIDNYLFGVAAVGEDGNESVVVFPDR